MPAAKPISKDMCLTAMDKTKSVKAAARYLNCSYHHLKRYMKLYVDEESGKTLFELHKNQQGKGIRKHFGGKEPRLDELMSGETYVDSYDINKYKSRLVQEGIIKEECCRCGHSEQRVSDLKAPLLIAFKDYVNEGEPLSNSAMKKRKIWPQIAEHLMVIGGVATWKELPLAIQTSLFTDFNLRGLFS